MNRHGGLQFVEEGAAAVAKLWRIRAVDPVTDFRDADRAQDDRNLSNRLLHVLDGLGRHMKTTDIIRLLSSPFRRRTLTRKPELPARMLDLGLKEPDRHAVSLAGLQPPGYTRTSGPNTCRPTLARTVQKGPAS